VQSGFVHGNLPWWAVFADVLYYSSPEIVGWCLAGVQPVKASRYVHGALWVKLRGCSAHQSWLVLFQQHTSDLCEGFAQQMFRVEVCHVLLLQVAGSECLLLIMSSGACIAGSQVSDRSRTATTPGQVCAQWISVFPKHPLVTPTLWQRDYKRGSLVMNACVMVVLA
jgi:hypothetical protein